MRVTQTAIANQLGVSKMTVSLALRNHHSVSSTVRERIRRAAKDLGYRPDPALKSLARYRRDSRVPRFKETIAWLNVTNRPDIHLKWPELQLLFRGACQQAESLGYRISPVWTGEEGMTFKRIHEVLSARGIRGILLPISKTKVCEDEFPWDHYCVLRIGDDLSSWPTFHSLSADHRWAMQLCLDSCRIRGYKRIGYLTTMKFEDYLNWSYLSSYQAAQCKRDDAAFLPIEFLKNGEWSPEQFIHFVRQHRPDALILPNEKKCIPQCIDFLKKTRMIEELGICFPCLPSGIKGRWTGIDEGFKNLGQKAIDCLARMLEQQEFGLPLHPVRQLVRGTWINGDYFNRADLLNTQENCSSTSGG